ncbi:hypothetical protein G6F47_006392 [Rhizopus delemar]|nr:hypothetical protein G6F54_010964 [Rhizopus delemar]KAG1501304.1 hypothetical protein G6F53_011115 [Rhizopus delemar]KAG1590531.1 hypothetical protein G6F48_003901 [Rhizopus delemar]KAG1598464.1 hypothetical protein G6F47_006392 [Rhizopus delemar]
MKKKKTKLPLALNQDNIQINNKHYDSSSEDKYELLVNEHLGNLISPNNVRNIDNPFDSDCVSFSFVTPITLNNNNTYGIIDTGTNVSVINKNFANANNIEFNYIPCYHVLANSNKIPQMQATYFINVKYDNIDRVIKHKFDVADDSITSYDNKIHIGVDLRMLSILLMNATVKYKSTEKEKEDSIVDKAYEPDISRAGTDKEQKAFDLAIKSYIVANQ